MAGVVDDGDGEGSGVSVAVGLALGLGSAVAVDTDGAGLAGAGGNGDALTEGDVLPAVVGCGGVTAHPVSRTAATPASTARCG